MSTSAAWPEPAPDLPVSHRAWAAASQGDGDPLAALFTAVVDLETELRELRAGATGTTAGADDLTDPSDPLS